MLFLTSDFWLLTPSFAATHVTGSYDLGANPHVMATFNGVPQYGLVFAQLNKLVLYNDIQYGTAQIRGYLDATGQLNDGAGNAWLDLIPNPAATPPDGYYVVTVNIQGQVHSEIWVVPDVPTVSATVCRQARAPSLTAPALFYQFLQKDGAPLAQRPTLNLSGAGVTCSDNAAQLRTDCALAGGGGSAFPASATTSGTVKTDTTEADPVVYLKSSSDSLLAGKANATHAHAESEVTNLVTDLAGKANQTHSHAEGDVTNLVSDLSAKVPASRNVSTSAPLSGGGSLASDLTLACPNCEVTTNKNAANGYAGLTASSKIAVAQVQEVLGVADLTDYSGKSGSGTTAIGATISSPSDNQCLIYSAGNWVNGSCAGGSSNHNLLSATHPDTVAASPVLGDLLYANSAPAWTKLTGNTTTTKKFLTQTGNGSASAAPGWGTIAAGDLPTHTHAESDVTNLVTDLAAKEAAANKNAANGYAGLTASTKVNAAQIQEVISSADLTDFASKSGSGTTILGTTITSPGTTHYLGLQCVSSITASGFVFPQS